MRNGIALLVSLLLLACGPSAPPIVLPDGGPSDAGAVPDAAPGDAGSGDAGLGVRVTIDTTGSMSVARLNHTATLLPSGRVVFIGGEDLSRAPNTSIEEYDPTTGTFEEVATLPVPRVNHTATLLADGRVLVAGGGASASNGIPTGTSVVASALLYDPATRAVTDAAELAHPRGHHAAARLPDGRVLVAGGAAPAASGFASVGELEIYDPTGDTWSGAGTLAVPRAMARLVEVDDGVLVIGGLTSSGTAPDQVEHVDAASGEVTAAGTLAGPGRLYHATLRTTDGTVLVVGGLAPPFFVPAVDVLGPADDAFRALTALPSPRNSVALVETEAGVLAIGGFYYSASEGGIAIDEVLALDPATDRLELVGSIPAGRAGHTATVLASGDVLVAGGYTAFGITDIAFLVHAE